MPTMTAVHQDYAHHSEQTPDATIGPWRLYVSPPDVFSWCPTMGPKEQAALAVEMADWEPEDPQPKPLPTPPADPDPVPN